MFARIAFSTLATTGTAYFYFGLNKPIIIEDRKTNDQIFVYKEVTGDYWRFNPRLKELKNDFHELTRDKVKLGAVYYDDPLNLEDRSEGRAVIGGFFDPSEQEIAKKFLAKNPNYKSIETQSMDVIATTIPHKMYTNFHLSRWGKARSKAYKRGLKKSKFEPKDFIGLLETYPYLNGGEHEVQVMVPYGPNAQRLKLSTLPPPKEKENSVFDVFSIR